MSEDDVLSMLFNDHPDLRLLSLVADEVERRETRTQRLPVVRYSDESRERRQLAPPGTAVLLIARPGTEALLKIRDVYSQPNKLGVEENLVETIYQTLGRREPVPLDEAVRLFIEHESSLDLSYRGKPLVSNAFLPPDLEFAAFSMPYTGGPINDDEFILTAHTRSNGQNWLDAILVINEPKLTELEKSALDLVPLDDSAVQIGKAAMCYAITAVTVFLVVAGATYACPGAHEVFHIDDPLVRNMPPHATARQLLSLRRQALERRR